MLILRTFPLAVAIVVSNCNHPPGGTDDKGDDDPLVTLCEQNCIKPFCDPTLEPTDDAEQQCKTTCLQQVEDVDQSDGCADVYTTLQGCLDMLTCDEFGGWLEQVPGALCIEEEQELANVCPEIVIRK